MKIENNDEKQEIIDHSIAENICPVCGEELNVSGRCKTCYSCGFSLCSM